MSWDEDVRDVRLAGGSDGDVLQLQSARTGDLLQAGATQDDLDTYFGRRKPEVSKAAVDAFRAPAPQAGGEPVKAGESFRDAVLSGLQTSVAGLAIRGSVPDITLSENAGWAKRLVANSAQWAADLPFMVAGGAAGAAPGGMAGAALGSAVLPAGGTIVGAGAGVVAGMGAGAFALPELLRRELMAQYQKGSTTNFEDFFARHVGALKDAAKQGVVGASTAIAGAAVGPVALAEAAPFISGAAQSAAEVGTMVSVGKAIEGQVPTARDFQDAALAVGAMHLAGAGFRRANDSVSRTEDVATKLRDVYALNGAKPEQVAQAAQANADVLQLIHDVGSNADAIAARINATPVPRMNGELPPQRLPQMLPDAEAPDASGEIEASLARLRLITDPPESPPFTPPPPPETPAPTLIERAEQRNEPAHYVDFLRRADTASANFSASGDLNVYRADDEVFIRKRLETETDPGMRNQLEDELASIVGGRAAKDARAAGDIDAGGVDDARAEYLHRLGEAEKAARAGDSAGAQAILEGQAQEQTAELAQAGEEARAGQEGDVLGTQEQIEENRKFWRANPDAAQAHIDAAINRDGTVPDSRTWKQRFKDAWRTFYRKTYDGNQPVLDATRDIVGTDTTPAQARAYVKISNMAGLPDKVADIIENGWRDADGNRVSKGVPAILKSVPDPKTLIDYGAASRAVEKAKQGIETGINRYAAEVFVAKHRAVYDAAFRDLIAFRERGTDRLIESGVVPPLEAARFREKNKDFLPFYRVMEESAGAGGAPFGRTPSGNPINVMEGSTRQIVNPLVSIIKDTYLFSRIADANEARGALVDLARANPEGATGVLEKVTPDGMKIEDRLAQAADVDELKRILESAKGEGDDFGGLSLNTMVAFTQPKLKANEFTYRNNGVPEVWRTDAATAAVINGTDREALPSILKILSVPTSLERAGILNTPAFMIRHAIRNPIQAMFTTRNGLTPWDLVAGLQSYMSGDANFQEFIANGGGTQVSEGLDRYLQKDVFSLSKETGLIDTTLNSLRNGLQAMHAIARTSDSAIRMAEFLKSRAAGKDAETAAFEARRVIPDAARAGTAARTINALVPFFHMEWQGLDALARAAVEQPGRVGITAGFLAAASAAVWSLGKGDSRVQDINDEQRDLFWIVPTDDWRKVDQADSRALSLAMARPGDQRREVDGELYTNEGPIYRIPKPFQAGIIFGSGTERLLDAYYSRKPDAFKNFGKSIAGAMFRQPIPAFAKPMIEQFANRSTFTGNPIVPESVLRELPEARYTENTSEPAKLLAGVIAKVPYIGRDASAFVGGPMVIDNYIRSWTGDVGAYAMEVASKAMRGEDHRIPGHQLIAGLEDTSPFVRAFVVRHPTSTSQSIQDFHDEDVEYQQIKATLAERGRKGDMAAVNSLQQLRQEEFSGYNLSEAHASLANQAKLIRTIQDNSEMKPYEKRQAIDGVYYQMAAIAQSAKTQLRRARAIAEGGPQE